MTERFTYLTVTGLRQRGWTDAMVRELLGAPDVQGRDPRRWSVAPVRLYRLARVEALERTPEFAACAASAGRSAAAARAGAERRRQAVLAAIRAEPIQVPVLPQAELERRAVRHRRLLGEPSTGGGGPGPGTVAGGDGRRGGAGTGSPGAGDGRAGDAGPGGAGSDSARAGDAGTGGAGRGSTRAGDAGPGGAGRGGTGTPDAGPGGAGTGGPGPGGGGALVRWQVDYLRHVLSRYDTLLDGLFGATGRAEAERLLRARVYGAIARAYPRLAAECARRVR
ncbi:hypothetical protein ACPCAC_02015 [Streptomyces lavendulocolor]|uniref:hypothetical protein n=1 Tax=Streptomyces lavendulocolor TaxID=67316 RepID=UPI003C2F4041